MALTDLEIRQAIPRDKEWKLTDGNGHYLLIRPSGSKLWRFKYPAQGKEQKLSFGAYPQTTLKEARLRRGDARVEIGRGGDPARKKRQAKIEAIIRAGDTFEKVAQEYVAKCEAEGFATATLLKTNWFISLFKRDIGHRPVAEITPHEMLAALKKIERVGRRESARRARSFASRVFRYAVATLRAEHDPCAPLKGALTAPVPRHYPAITDPMKFGGLLRSIEAYEGNHVTMYALKLAPHVFVRPGELRHAEWSEFDFEKAVWWIPAGKMKSRRDHAVPLSRQVLGMLEKWGELEGKRGYVFPAMHTKRRPMSENTINASLRRRTGPGPHKRADWLL